MLKACKKCRREGVKLILKGERCLSPKCAVLKRAYAPGEHGQGKFSKTSEYGKQLREKQKARRIYGMGETQFANYAKKSNTMSGNKSENMIRLLELRFDNILYRAGYAVSRSQSQQFISHGSFTVNGKKVDISSYQLKVGDIIKPKDTERFKNVTLNSAISWVTAEKKSLSITINHLPSREEIDTPINESLIIEYYSR